VIKKANHLKKFVFIKFKFFLIFFFYLKSTDDDNNVKQENDLNTTLTILSNRCAELDQANQAWQQFHQSQIENFQNILRDYIPLDGIISFDQAAQLIINEIDKQKEKEDELLDIKERCRDLEHINKQLLTENEKLNDRSIVVGHHSALEPTILGYVEPVCLLFFSYLQFITSLF